MMNISRFGKYTNKYGSVTCVKCWQKDEKITCLILLKALYYRTFLIVLKFCLIV